MARQRDKDTSKRRAVAGMLVMVRVVRSLCQWRSWFEGFAVSFGPHFPEAAAVLFGRAKLTSAGGSRPCLGAAHCLSLYVMDLCGCALQGLAALSLSLSLSLSLAHSQHLEALIYPPRMPRTPRRKHCREEKWTGSPILGDLSGCFQGVMQIYVSNLCVLHRVVLSAEGVWTSSSSEKLW